MTNTTANPVVYDLGELAEELDVSRETIDALAGQINDDPALYDPATERVTEAGAELIRSEVRSQSGSGDVLADVEAAAAALETAKECRDAAVRAAFKVGAPRTAIARAAGLSRERVYQIVQGC